MNNKSHQKKNESIELGEFVCGECGGKNIETTWQSYKFPYGIGTDAVELSCEVPMRKCKDCGFSFMDREAEDLCHEAICKHLGVMNPTQIKALRELYKHTQAQFSRITKLGEATLSRWERGILVQNSAYDNYLYLLGFRENIDRLLNRQEQEIPKELTVMQETVAHFREIEVTEELRRKQAEFELQPCLMPRE